MKNNFSKNASNVPFPGVPLPNSLKETVYLIDTPQPTPIRNLCSSAAQADSVATSQLWLFNF